MFWAFKLSFEVEISVFWATFFQTLGEILFRFLVTLKWSDCKLFNLQSFVK
jgi:hypothetical protein